MWTACCKSTTPSSAMIKNLLFDMGGVICPMQDAAEPADRFRRIGLSGQLARQYFGRNGQQGIFREAEDGTLSPDGFLEAYHRLTGYRATFDEIEWAWRGFVFPPTPDRLQALRQLRAEGYHLALASNTNPFLQRWEESADFTPEGKGIQVFFDKLYYSYELKAYKPDALFFQRILQQGGYRSEETIFLDDSPKNVEAARQAGLQAIYVPDNRSWVEPLREALEAENK